MRLSSLLAAATRAIITPPALGDARERRGDHHPRDVALTDVDLPGAKPPSRVTMARW